MNTYSTQPTVAARGTATTTASGTLTVATPNAGDTVSIGGQAFTAVASGTPSNVQFLIGDTSAATATNIAAAINAHATLSTVVTAAANAGVVTLTSKVTGLAGNYIALVSSSPRVTASGATLAGGTGTGKSIITVGGLQFRDSSGDGQLQPYEDWRRLEYCRAKDLANRLTIDQKIGLMSEGSFLGNGTADGTIAANIWNNIATLGYRMGKSSVAVAATQHAVYVNHLDELTEALPWGIPVTVNDDPPHATTASMSASGALAVQLPSQFSPWPYVLGVGAIGDENLTWEYGDLTRREYMAAGLRWQLGPQADLATEPRWLAFAGMGFGNSANGTFGSNALVVAKHLRAMVAGMQGSETGDLRNGIAAQMKHFPGWGATAGGMDAHNYAGRFTVFPGGAREYHLIPFQAAFDVGAAAFMPNYTIQKEQYDWNPYQVATAFNYNLVTLLARRDMGFRGLISDDWGTVGHAYNLEGLTLAERAAMHVAAGSNQFGSDNPVAFKDALTQGLVTEEQLAKHVTKILEFTMKLGLFENPYTDSTQSAANSRSVANRQAGFDAMKRAMVLLRNTNHLGGSNRYLPIVGTRSYLDGNSDGTITVWYDGVVDSLTESASGDYMDDVFGSYNYTSAGGSGALPIAGASGLATADIAVLRIVARGGSASAPIPCSFDGTLTPQQLQYGNDSTLAPAAASKAKVLDAFRVRDGYTKSDGTVVPPANPTLKIVVVIHFSKPPIVRGFVNGLVSLDELPGKPGSYPSVSDEANIRQTGVTYPIGGGIDGLIAEFGATDRAVLDVVFNKNLPAGVAAYGEARLPFEVPSSDAEVEAQFEDVPNDTYAPTYRVGAGSAMPTN